MEPNTHFKEIRTKLKLSQVELAAQLGVTQGTITDIERGRIGVSKKIAKRLQEKFGLELKDIYGDSAKEYNGTATEDNTEKKGTALTTALESLKEMHQKVLRDLPTNPNRQIASSLNFELLKGQHLTIKQVGEMFRQYTVLSDKFFEFFSQYNQLYSPNIQTEIYQELSAGATEQQVRDSLNQRIHNLQSLTETCSHLSEELKSSLDNFRTITLPGGTEYV